MNWAVRTLLAAGFRPAIAEFLWHQRLRTRASMRAGGERLTRLQMVVRASDSLRRMGR